MSRSKKLAGSPERVRGKEQGPLGTVGDGRDASGRFASGNKVARGNPHAKKVGALRSALFRAVTGKDMRAIVGSLVEQAKAGDVQAAKEVLLRTLGRPTEIDLIERLERLEQMLAERAGGPF